MVRSHRASKNHRWGLNTALSVAKVHTLSFVLCAWFLLESQILCSIANLATLPLAFSRSTSLLSPLAAETVSPLRDCFLASEGWTSRLMDIPLWRTPASQSPVAAPLLFGVWGSKSASMFSKPLLTLCWSQKRKRRLNLCPQGLTDKNSWQHKALELHGHWRPFLQSFCCQSTAASWVSSRGLGTLFL